MTQRRDLKRYARQALNGKYASVILALIIVEALSFFCGSIAGELFPGNSALDVVLGNAFTFIVTLLVNVVTAGMGYMYLNIARGKDYSMGDLFYFYKHHPDRVITAAFVLALINLITMLPANLYNYNYDFSTVMNSAAAYITTAEVEAVADYAVHFLVLMIAGLLVYQVVTIPLEMTYFLLADHPQMKGMEAIKESIRMMKGNFWRMLLLKLSFLPLLILSAFTFYIALLWVLPYMNMTSAMFYRDLRRELDTETVDVQTDSVKYSQAPHQEYNWAPAEPTDADKKTDMEEVLHFEKADSESEQDIKTAVHLKKTADIVQKAENGQEKEPAAEKVHLEKPSEPEKPAAKQEPEEEEDNTPKPWDEYFNRSK